MGLISKPIMAKLARRFNIRQAQTQQLESGDLLIPITDADDFVREPKLQQTSTTTTTRTDTYTVPLDKTWRILFASIERSNAGDCNWQLTVNGTSFRIVSGTATTVLTYEPQTPMRLKGGDAIFAQMATGTSGVITSTIYYLEEDS